MINTMKNVLKRFFQNKSAYINILLPVLLLAILTYVMPMVYDSTYTNADNVGIFISEPSLMSEYITDVINGNDEYKAIIYDDENKMKDDMINQKIITAIIMSPDADQKYLNQEAFITIEGENSFHVIKDMINQNLNILDTLLASTNHLEEAISLNKQTIENKVKINSESSNFNSMATVTGLALYVMSFSLLSHGRTILEDRTYGTYRRIMATPIKKTQYILGNIFAWLTIASIQIILMDICLMIYKIEINYFVFSIILFVTSFVMCMLSLLINISATSRKGAMMIQSLLATPLAMLGGMFWPIYITPELMQNISKLTPLYWSMQMINKISAKFTLVDILPDLTVLTLFGVAFIFITVYIMKNKSSKAF